MKQQIVAFIDANNFYCSCERAFNAALHNRPVLVLSNNDGCVVARSNEVKKLGVKMGQPVFQIEDLIREHDIQVFSSNYSLYGNVSARMMSVLAQFSARQEVYSIDESFLDLTAFPIEDLTTYGRHIKARVYQYTGIPVSVAIAPTKCLSKIGAEVVKQNLHYEGVLDLTALSEQEIDEVLAQVAIEDVWGIGQKYALLLRNYGLLSARDLKYADDRWIRKHLTVIGQRIVLELRGIVCIPLEPVAPAKKGIMSAKTFGREISELAELKEAVAMYTTRVAEKLREQGSLTLSLTVFVHTNHFHTQAPQYANSTTIHIPYPTAFTPELIHYALEGLNTIYRDGFSYRKVGIYLSRISPEGVLQPDLFGGFSTDMHFKRARLMTVIDTINRIYGHDTLCFGVQGIDRPWKMRQMRLSGRFTTQWKEIPLVTM